ncbi:MAG TPA: hypothetical protein VF176_07385 [Solirubrobacterales bacterium]
MTAWKLPFIVAALAVPIVAGFLIGGPGVGVAVGALAAVAILVVAARMQPRGPIASAAGDGRRHVLIVVACAVENPGSVAAIARAAGIAGGDVDAEVMLLAPARSSFLDRWATDLDAARHAAQRNLVVTVASLAKAEIEAEARVGDEDLVQAVEDQLRSFPATEVVLVSEAGGEEVADAAASELEERLEAEFRHVVLPCD